MRKTVLIAALLVMLLPSCKRMPLYNKETKLELELQLDLDLELELDLDVDVDIELEAASIKIPEYLKTNFFSPSNGDIQYTQFVGPEGGQLSIGPGRYIMLIYSFGTEYVQIRGENNLNTIEAFTSDITASKMHSLEKFYKNNTKADELNEPIIYAPTTFW